VYGCDKKPCGANAECSNSNAIGGYTCKCKAGFQGDGYKGCTEINECKSSPCGYGARCVDRIAGYNCVCPAGTTGNPFTTGCKPIQG